MLSLRSSFKIPGFILQYLRIRELETAVNLQNFTWEKSTLLKTHQTALTLVGKLFQVLSTPPFS